MERYSPAWSNLQDLFEVGNVRRLYLVLVVGLVLVALAALANEFLSGAERTLFLLACSLQTIYLGYCFTADTQAARNGVGFAHVFVFVSVAGWVGYGFSGAALSRIDGLGIVAIAYWQHMLGLAVTLMVWSLPLPGGFRERGPEWYEDLLISCNKISLAALVLLFLLVAALAVYRMSLGLVFSGTGLIMEQVSSWQSALVQLGLGLDMVALLVGLLLVFDKDPLRRAIGYMLIGMQLLFAFAESRRAVVGVIMAGFLLWVARYRIKGKQLLFMAVLSIFVVGFVGPFFAIVRNEAWIQGVHVVDPDYRIGILGDSIRVALSEFDFSKPYSSDYQDNVKNRVAFYEYAVMLQGKITDGWEPRNGEVAYYGLLESVPSMFWPNKRGFLGNYNIEQKVQVWFGEAPVDAGGTLLGYAIADGGVVGVMIYFGVLGFCLWMLRNFSYFAKHPLLRIWAVSSVFVICFWIESSIASVMSVMRLLLVLYVLDKILGVAFPRRAYL